MQLNLTKPLVFFDLETTGTNIAQDRIVEISMIKVFPDGHDEEKTYRINPTIPISAEATAIHHITDADVANCPTFKEKAHEIEQYFKGCDIAGFNSNRFDIPLLVEEFLRVGLDIDFRRCNIIDVQNIYHKKEQRTLVAAYKTYCNKDLETAHSANGDTRATYEVLKAQLDRYPDLQNDAKALADYSRMQEILDYSGRLKHNENNDIVFNFGKHKNKPVRDVLLHIDPNYYDWIMKSDFTLDFKNVMTKLLYRFKSNNQNK